MPTGVTRVNGGIISDQMLTGHLRYFKMVGDFAPTVSEGTVNIDSMSSGGTAPLDYYFVVGSSEIARPVPGSFADHALRAITEKCTVVEIGLVGTPGSETELHFSAANTAFGWIDDDGLVDVVAMQDAVLASADMESTPGSFEVPNLSGGTDDPLSVPVTKVVPAAVTITEVPFVLV